MLVTGLRTPKRILLVEDDPDAAETFRDLLESDGHVVRTEYFGETAATAARDFHPDIVICDLGLPGLDGFGVASALRAAPELRGVRLIAVSGRGSDEDVKRSREAGFDEHLTKPIDIASLLAKLSFENGALSRFPPNGS